MHVRCAECRVPDREDAVIWRYMDFTKLVLLLDRRALFFTRADRFSDKFEGSVSTLVARRDWLPEARAAAERTRFLRERTGISSWHVNDHESAAMWELYLKSDEGVAIRSTYGRLARAIDPSRADVHLGLVRYIDFESDRIPDGRTSPFLHKRRSFAHERELRGIVCSDEPLDRGLFVDVDLDVLVERVYVAPYAPDWFYELVQRVAERYGLHQPIARSDLDRDPIE